MTGESYANKVQLRPWRRGYRKTFISILAEAQTGDFH